jgi:DNA-binding MarR family transcriptional regulator
LNTIIKRNRYQVVESSTARRDKKGHPNTKDDLALGATAQKLVNTLRQMLVVPRVLMTSPRLVLIDDLRPVLGLTCLQRLDGAMILRKTISHTISSDSSTAGKGSTGYMSGFVDHPPIPPVLENDEIDPVTLQAFHSLGRLFHLHRQAMRRRLSSPVAHHGELISLRLLTSSDGLSQKDLAETMHLSRPRVTSILQGLEKAGAVRREVDAIDQRITRVFLTAEGRRQEVENRAAFEEYIMQTIGKLSDPDKLELTRLLDLVSGHVAELVCADGHEHGVLPS